MPATKKKPAKSTARSRAAKPTRARLEHNDRTIGRVGKSLEDAQKDLTAIGASLGTGATDLSKDVVKLLRVARRDVTKMGKTVRRDLEHLQKDLGSASKARPRRARASKAK
jgi:hypothetical protein